MNISTDLSDEKIQSFLLKDSMGQNAFLSSLIKLLVEVDDGSIVDLDGQWGSGKTSVIREIQLISESALDIDDVKNIDKDIIKELQMNYSIFYFNAWENDQYNPSESIF